MTDGRAVAAVSLGHKILMRDAVDALREAARQAEAR